MLSDSRFCKALHADGRSAQSPTFIGCKLKVVVGAGYARI